MKRLKFSLWRCGGYSFTKLKPRRSDWWNEQNNHWMKMIFFSSPPTSGLNASIIAAQRAPFLRFEPWLGCGVTFFPNLSDFDVLMSTNPVFSPPVRSSGSSTVLRLRGTLRITKTSSSWCCVPMSATPWTWAENSWTRSPRKLSVRAGATCRRGVTWTWSTTLAHTSLMSTSQVSCRPGMKVLLSVNKRETEYI